MVGVSSMMNAGVKGTMVTSTNSTYLFYGETGSGKTRLASSFPSPFFISAAHERGFDTVEALWQKKRELFFNPEVKPINRYVSTPTEYSKAFDEAKALIEKGKVQTVAIDTLSAYADGYIDFLKQSGVQGYDLWNSLKDHIRHMMIEAHKLPANIIWTAWAITDDEQGQPLMPSQKLAPMISGLCKYVLYLRVLDTKEGPRWEIRTKKCGKFQA
jgi:hypothetical protein